MVWESFLRTMLDFTKKTYSFIQQIPGFDRLNTCDLGNIMHKRLFNIFGLITTKLLVEDEYFLILSDNIRCCKYWIEKCLSKEICKKIFEYHYDLNALELTDNELALLIPVLLTSPG